MREEEVRIIFLNEPTEAELDAVDPSKPLLFDPYGLKIVQGIFYFYEMFFGLRRISFIFDIIMGWAYVYLGLFYVSTFFFTSVFFSIPFEYLIFLIFP